jgi:replicative DNA helicase
MPTIRDEKVVLFVSLEMLPSELTMRLLSNMVGMDSQSIRCNLMSSSEKRLVESGLQDIRKYSYVYGRPGHKTTVEKIRGAARKIKRTRELGMVVVDYLQRVSATGKHQNREREVALISSSLKDLSMEFAVPVLALCQLNRGLDYDKDREPEFKDLRESGAIEQDSDVVMFLHGPADSADRQILVKKQRGGPNASIPVRFLRSIGRFE